jgi:hypothetical protein
VLLARRFGDEKATVTGCPLEEAAFMGVIGMVLCADRIV